MKVLHIMPYTIFAVNYVNGIQKVVNGDHKFYLYGDASNLSQKEMQFPQQADVIHESAIERDTLAEQILSADVVVLHCLPEDLQSAQTLIQILKTTKVCLVIVPWGRDLFKTSDMYLQASKEQIKEIDQYKDYLLEHADVLCVSQKGYDFLKQQGLSLKAKKFSSSILFSVRSDEIASINIDRTPQQQTGIMVGHRGTATSGHKEVFQHLNSFENRNFQIICPLSYGRKNYIESVISLGNLYFSNNFIPLTKWEEKQKYYQYLAEHVDIAVFNTATSEGITNMIFLLGCGTKMYINPKSEYYRMLTELGFQIYPYSVSIPEEVFLKKLSREEVTENRRIAIDFCAVEKIASNWEKLLSYCASLSSSVGS